MILSTFVIAQGYFKTEEHDGKNQLATLPKQENSGKYDRKMLHLVRQCIAYDDSLSCTNEIFELVDRIENYHCFLQTGTDDFRSKFIRLQASFEHVMACYQALGEITRLVGVIHTPTPATPLCIRPEEGVTVGILDERIRWDSDKLLTVCSRARIVREYLMKGGQLYIAYPQGGLEKRSEGQRVVYLEALKEFQNGLFDSVLNCNEMNSDMIGATYLFKNIYNQVFAFSIKGRQANDVRPESEWGIWFGEIQLPKVRERIDLIFDYLKFYGGPDLRQDKFLFSRDFRIP